MLGNENLSKEQTYARMAKGLAKLVPEIEMAYKAELAYEINQLKKEKNAIILGHNYMEPALFYSVPDFVGDSLELARKAATSTADRIVFCGVRFMAETAKILNPSKMVLLPTDKGGCSLASAITAEDVIKLKQQYPGLPVISYVNTYADVKAESDACCTSSNAAAIVASFDSPSVIFLPDQFLAANVARETGKELVVPLKDVNSPVVKTSGIKPVMIGWPGKCEVHERFTVEDIKNARQHYPDVVVVAHPECPPDVVAAADFAGSTKAMIDFVKNTSAEHFLVLTECAMGDNIMAANPGKELLRLCSIRCPHMNEITLEQTLASLKEDRYQIEVPEQTAIKAKRALEYMISIG